MPIRNENLIGFILIVPALIVAGCAQDTVRAKTWPERLQEATARLRQDSTQEELDEYAYTLMDGRSINYEVKMTGETGAAIAAAYRQFLALGLARRADEMSVRLVAVARKSINGEGYYIVEFQPRYMPASKLPQSPDEPLGLPHWFYPVSTYWFYIRERDFGFERYEVIPD